MTCCSFPRLALQPSSAPMDGSYQVLYIRMVMSLFTCKTPGSVCKVVYMSGTNGRCSGRLGDSVLLKLVTWPTKGHVWRLCSVAFCITWYPDSEVQDLTGLQVFMFLLLTNPRAIPGFKNMGNEPESLPGEEYLDLYPLASHRRTAWTVWPCLVQNFCACDCSCVLVQPRPIVPSGQM